MICSLTFLSGPIAENHSGPFVMMNGTFAPIEVPPAPANYAFEADTAYESSRGLAGRALLALRRVLNPILKLFINPNPIIYVLNRQSLINTHNEEQFVRVERVAALNYEVLHNLVVELNNEEVPIMDGSAAPFVLLIQQAGIEAQPAARRFVRVRTRTGQAKAPGA